MRYPSIVALLLPEILRKYENGKMMRVTRATEVAIMNDTFDPNLNVKVKKMICYIKPPCIYGLGSF